MLLDGKQVSDEIKQQLKNKVRNYLIKPCLVVIQVGDDEASNVYIRSKERACNEIGVYFKHIKFEESVREREIINKIIELNNDEYVHGILLQLPIPEKFNTRKLINLIHRDKDVDGLTDSNAGKLFKNNYHSIPCTPQGIMELLDYYKIELEGKKVTIVGRSNLVGKPLSMLLLDRNATVTICHSKTEDLKEHTLNADIIITAVGKRNILTEDMVKKGVIVIDVGMNHNEEGKLCGDVDFEKVSKKASYITPVPGGVGPMTVAMLLENVVKNYEKE